MPIHCLTAIKFSSQSALFPLSPDDAVGRAVEGVYQFSLADFGQHVALFSDGCPALMLMPDAGMGSVCRVDGQIIPLGAVWFTAGILQRAVWEPLGTTGKLTIIRFRPQAWQKLSAKPTGEPPYIHDMATYHPELEAKFLPLCKPGIGKEEIGKLLRAMFSDVEDGIRADPQDVLFFKSVHTLSVKTWKQEYHPKWVQRFFKKRFGVSPYQYEQLQRFLCAFRRLETAAAESLHAVAFLSGYCDANHLIKDFKKYLGTTPRHFFRGRIN